jgi:hypothetical protein
MSFAADKRSARHGAAGKGDPYTNSSYIVSESLAAAITAAPAIDCRDFIAQPHGGKLTLSISIASTSDPEGPVYIQGSQDGVTWPDLPLATDSVLSNHAAVTHSSSAPKIIDVDDPAANANVQVTLVDLMPYHKVRYARDGGGSATGCSVAYTLS